MSKLMILPVDNPHGIANELAEIRCVTTMGLPDCSKAIPVRNWGKPHCRQYIKAARDF